MEVYAQYRMYAEKLAVLLAALHHMVISFFQNGAMHTKSNRLDGKVVIITGCSTGLGKAAAIELAQRGAKLYMTCIDIEKCEEAREEVIKLSNNHAVFARELDLSSLKSVRMFVQQFHKEELRLDILINNPGALLLPKSKTVDGFESVTGNNYLGHFLLTHLLLDLLKASAPSQILNLSSASISESYSKCSQNDNNNLACNLFTLQLGIMLTGTGVTVNSVDLSEVAADVGQHLTWRRAALSLL